MGLSGQSTMQFHEPSMQFHADGVAVSKQLHIEGVVHPEYIKGVSPIHWLGIE